MSDAPERIWVDFSRPGGIVYDDGPFESEVEYIRADKAEAERDALFKTIGELTERNRAQSKALEGMHRGDQRG